MKESRVATWLARVLPYLLGLLTGVVIGLGALLYLMGSGKLGSGGAAAPVAVQESRRNAIVAAVEKTRRSVVTIRAGGLRDVTDRMPWYMQNRRWYAPLQWVGSGLVVDRDGYIITNEHVVRGASEIAISIGDRDNGSSMRARLVGVAPGYDLALLQVDATFDDNVSRLGDSDDLLVGEWAIAIGSPFGYDMDNPEPSVSVGVISAVGQDLLPEGDQRSNWPYQRMIQTDAAINDGNSGGPLVNGDGEVIGINVAHLSEQGLKVGSVGVNFSIPINTVKWVWEELRQYGRVRQPWIGLGVQDMSPVVRRELAVPEDQAFITVTQVVAGSPAAKAGLAPGDYIHSINGMVAYTVARANRILFGTRVGSVVDVEVLQGGKMRHAMVDVEEDPSTRAERQTRASPG